MVSKRKKFRQRIIRWVKPFSQKRFVLYVALVILTVTAIAPVRAQFPSLPDWRQPPNWLSENFDELVVSACVRLDGRCVFRVSANPSELSDRVETIEERLEDIAQSYFNSDTAQVTVRTKSENNLLNIYVATGGREVRLLTVTNLDIRREGLDLNTKAQQIIDRLETGLARAKRERQPKFLIRQGAIAIGGLGLVFVLNGLINRSLKGLRRSKENVAHSGKNLYQPISSQLIAKRQWNLKEVQYRLLQLAQTGVWVGGTLLILGLFPYTRTIQLVILTAIRIPLRIAIVSLVTYLCIRLSYALIAQLNSALATNYLLTPEANQRLQLRLTTISVVVRGIVTVIWIGIGILFALSAIGLDLAPVLAGAGIIGLAVSLASQNLIKDAINGFFIILEDQYAVGDVINVADVGGLVENMNLRITQLRDPEGRLITIPNSEIKIVANLSSHWSRADLNIPVAYQANIDLALATIAEVAEDMSQDEIWHSQILAKPRVLGIENFDERGIIVRVWIETQPLKQWDVAREFRRRIKLAFDRAGIPLPLPQQQVWLQKNGSHARSNSSRREIN